MTALSAAAEIQAVLKHLHQDQVSLQWRKNTYWGENQQILKVPKRKKIDSTHRKRVKRKIHKNKKGK